MIVASKFEKIKALAWFVIAATLIVLLPNDFIDPELVSDAAFIVESEAL